MYFTNANIAGWRIDDDGLLRVTANVLAAGVYDYAADESPENAEKVNGAVPQYISADEFTEDALHTLEGKPVVVGHSWRNPGNAHDTCVVGSVAGTPSTDGRFISCDFIITDADAIQRIKSGELQAVSAGYTGDCVIDAGDYEGKPYTVRQKNIQFNHVALLPPGKGRCGDSVRILNNKDEEVRMAKVTMQFGERRKTYSFQNEEDVAVAEEMVEEQKTFNAEELAAAVSSVEELKAQLAEVQAKLDEQLAIVAEQKQQIEQLMSAEGQTALAEEAAAQVKDEEEVINSMDCSEEEREQLQNSVSACKTFAARRRCIVQNALRCPDNWTQDTVDGAFEALVAAAKRVQNSKKTVMGGTKAQVQNESISRLERVLRPMSVNK